jgi:hypothetical protein
MGQEPLSFKERNSSLRALEEANEAFPEGVEAALFSVAFPDDDDTPAGTTKRADVSSVAAYVGKPLSAPEFLVGGRRDSAVFAIVHVPKAPVNKNDLVEFREY